MTTFTSVDLSQLPLPNAVEQIDYDELVNEMKAQLNGLEPLLFDAETVQPTMLDAELVTGTNGEKYWRIPYSEEAGLLSLDLASDPNTKLIELFAYREAKIRQRVNEAVRAVLLATAIDEDLDNLGARWNVARQILQEADQGSGQPQVLESNASYRRRIQLRLEGISAAGPEGAYVYFALSASADVKDARIESPNPNEITITILSNTGDGEAPAQTITDVEGLINSTEQSIRPESDVVTVQSATIIEYTIEATLTTYAGPDAPTVIAEAEAAAQVYADKQHRLGLDVTLSGIYNALHQEGVQDVDLDEPPATIEVDPDEAAYCTGITLVNGGVAE